MAQRASALTLPYLIRGENDYTKTAKHLVTPWQSVGAKGVVTLASKADACTAATSDCFL